MTGAGAEEGPRVHIENGYRAIHAPTCQLRSIQGVRHTQDKLVFLGLVLSLRSTTQHPPLSMSGFRGFRRGGGWGGETRLHHCSSPMVEQHCLRDATTHIQTAKIPTKLFGAPQLHPATITASARVHAPSQKEDNGHCDRQKRLIHRHLRFIVIN